jgi:RNase adaptor protein for sRNA GlmZ degradation
MDDLPDRSLQVKIILTSTGKSSVLRSAAGEASGPPFNADLYIDCRGMVNPFRDPILGGLNGDAKPLQDWIRLKNAPYVDAAVKMIDTALASAPTRNSFRKHDGGEKELLVCFFCLAGVHRSRGLKHVVADVLRGMYGSSNVEVM